MTLAWVRARAAAASARNATSTSGTTNSGASLGKLRAPIGGDDGEAGLGCERCGDEVMPVAVIAGNGEERVAGSDGAAVD